MRTILMGCMAGLLSVAAWGCSCDRDEEPAAEESAEATDEQAAAEPAAAEPTPEAAAPAPAPPATADGGAH